MVTTTMSLLVFSILWINFSAANSEVCCNMSANEDCKEACNVFSLEGGESTESAEWQLLMASCSSSNFTFWSCVNATLGRSTDMLPTPVPSRFRHCCGIASTMCRSKCIETFEDGDNGKSPNELANQLVGTCGDVDIVDAFWRCILLATPPPPLTTPPPTIDEDANWAGLQCCYKAKDEKCKRSCLEFYRNKFVYSTFDFFKDICIHRPVEEALSTCVFDIEQGPCKLGCSGMQFCSNFNNRPYQSFRRCNIPSDGNAKRLYLEWARKNVMSHPLLLSGVAVTSVENCLPEMWKAIACVYTLEPCIASTHATQVCRKDCLKLLQTCSNYTNTPTRICDIIAPESVNSSCIPLDQFIAPSPFGDDVIAPAATSIDNPCDPNLCPPKQKYCVINRLCHDPSKPCLTHECRPTCVVGNSPGTIDFIKGSAVRVSLLPNATKRCFGYFNCTEPTEISQSTPEGGTPLLNFIPTKGSCEAEHSCTLPNGDVHAHQSQFWMSCNFCICNYGRLICTNRSCSNQSSLLSLNCNCNGTYDPVCTYNGITFPNSCTAMCLNYAPTTFHSGACGSIKQCSIFHSSICDPSSICVPVRHTCLSPDFSDNFCRQYRCESFEDGCSRTASQSPVCDQSNTQHSSLCSFLGTRNAFGYWGYCEEGCSEDLSSSVCGANGETFPSRCHAHSMHISVDYLGECSAIPSRDDGGTSLTSLCESVSCPELDFSGCRTVIPYGSCCPICGSSLVFLYDMKILGDNLAFLNKEYISSHDIIERLQHHVSYIQCQVYGHILEDGSMLLTLTPDAKAFNRYILSEVCYQEAVKLSTLINNQSPLVTNDVLLSHLVAAYVQNGTESVKSTISNTQFMTTTSNDAQLTATIIYQFLSLFVCVILHI